MAVESGLSVKVQALVGTRHTGLLGTPFRLLGQSLRQATAAAQGLQFVCRSPLQQPLGRQGRQGRECVQHTLYIRIGRGVQRSVAFFQQRPLETLHGIAEVLAQLAAANVQGLIGATRQLLKLRVDTLQGVQQLLSKRP